VHPSNAPPIFWAFLPYFYLFGASETTNGLLLSFNKLKYQAVARLISSLIGLICILLLTKKYGIFALLISLQLTQLVSLIVSSYGLYKEGIRFIWINPILILKSPGFLPIFSSLIFGYFFAQV
jgi:O-antigen/teichoic acid export membrane protein